MKTVSLVFLWGLGPFLNGEIIKNVNGFKEVQAKSVELLAKYAAKDILFIFDIDNVLIQPKHPAVHEENIAKYRDVYETLIQPLSQTEQSLLKALTAFSGESCLVEDCVPAVISELQGKKIKTIALTASHVGKFHSDEPTEEIRYRQLKSFSIDFSASYPDISSFIVFKEIPAYYGYHPVWHKGILVSNGEARGNKKANVLLSWLKHVKLPKIICFIDDKIFNLQQIEVVLAKYFPDLIFVGIELKAYLNTFTPKDILISKQDFKTFWKKQIREARSLSTKICE